MKRNGVLGLVALIFIVVLVTQRQQAAKVGQALLAGDWRWIVAAAVLQGGFYLFYTALQWASYRACGVRCRLLHMLPVMFASLALNFAVPGAGPILFIEDLVHRGESAAKATAGTLLVRIADFSIVLGILVVSMVYLARIGHLEHYIIIGAMVLAAIVLGFTLLLMLGWAQPGALHRLLHWAHRLVNRLARLFRRPAPLVDDWPERATREYGDAAVTIMERPHGVVRAVAVGIVAYGFDIASVWALFHAFGQPQLEPGTLVAGFAVGILFWIVTITPQGVGIVEGAMVLVYGSLDVPVATATAVTLAFRGLTFWLPAAVGFFILPRMSRRPRRPREARPDGT